MSPIHIYDKNKNIYYILYIIYDIVYYCLLLYFGSVQCGGADLATLQFRDLTNNATHTYIYIYIYICFLSCFMFLYGYTLDILYLCDMGKINERKKGLMGTTEPETKWTPTRN